MLAHLLREGSLGAGERDSPAEDSCISEMIHSGPRQLHPRNIGMIFKQALESMGSIRCQPDETRRGRQLGTDSAGLLNRITNTLPALEKRFRVSPLGQFRNLWSNCDLKVHKYLPQYIPCKAVVAYE